MIQRMVEKIIYMYNLDPKKGTQQYDTYFRVSLYKQMYQEKVDAELRDLGYEKVIPG